MALPPARSGLQWAKKFSSSLVALHHGKWCCSVLQLFAISPLHLESWSRAFTEKPQSWHWLFEKCSWAKGRIYSSHSRNAVKWEKQKAKLNFLLPLLSALNIPFLGCRPRKPWILGQTQINSSVRAVLGSSSTLTAVTTSRCFRGKWEDLSQPFPSHSLSHLLTVLIAVSQNACDFSAFGSCGWLNIAMSPVWGSWVSYSTNVGDAHLGNNLPPAI